MIKRSLHIIALFLFSALVQHASAQTDTSGRFVPADSIALTAPPVLYKNAIDSVMKNHSPKRAALRSAIVPGWGQAYNKKYWKIPIVYGALGFSGGVFVYNITQYRKLRFAFKARTLAELPVGQGQDTSLLKDIDEKLRIFGTGDLQVLRNEFRRNVDYSVLVFIALWGLQVIDASVDAHLKAFDVSPDLSLKFKPGYSEMARTNGLSVILALKK